MLDPAVLEHAAALAGAGAALAVARGVPVPDLSRQAVHALVDPGAPPSTAPVAVGDGFVVADLGVEENRALFATLLEVAEPHVLADPEALAAEAQEWRLPVVPYRRRAEGARGRIRVLARRPAGAAHDGVGSAPGASPQRRPSAAGASPQRGPSAAGASPPRASSSPLVLDLTALWAGPLTTSLLLATGARVLKVEPSVRPDGMRGTPHLHARLNAGKEVVDLDLSDPGEHARFLALAQEAALVVESFSPRVLGNLGIDHRALDAVAPGVTVLSLPAFDPTTPERGWIAHGTGVHAAVGLGETADGGFAAPPFPYPDPLTGLLAFATAQALLLGHERGTWHGGHVVVPMTAAVTPLVTGGDPLAGLADVDRSAAAVLQRPTVAAA